MRAVIRIGMGIVSMIRLMAWTRWGLFWSKVVSKGLQKALKSGIKKGGKKAAEENPENDFLKGVDIFLNG